MRFTLRLSHLRHMDMPYGTLPDPVQAVFSGIAPGQVIAATAFLPASMTDCFAAWRARPSVPDTWDGFQPCGILHTVGAAAALPPPPPCEGGRNEIKWERRAYTPTLPFSHRFCFVCTRTGARSKFFCDRLKGYSLSPSSQHNSSRLI